MVWASLLGFVFFGEVPDGWTLVGATLVVAAGIVSVRRVRASPTASRARGGVSRRSWTQFELPVSKPRAPSGIDAETKGAEAGAEIEVEAEADAGAEVGAEAKAEAEAGGEVVLVVDAARRDSKEILDDNGVII